MPYTLIQFKKRNETIEFAQVQTYAVLLYSVIYLLQCYIAIRCHKLYNNKTMLY